MTNLKVDFDNAELIGEGSYAKIYKFFSKEHKCYLCARKVTLKTEHLPQLQKQKEINRELMKLSNPYILKIYGIDENHGKDEILYLTQYCEGGSLFHCLDLLPNHILELYPTIAIALRIARGIQVLHNNKITHRDLKPENILLVKKYKPGFQVPQIKIADFGLSTNNIIMETIAGTKEYLAPEQAKFHNYTNAVDVWALGIIIDEMLHGNPYFVGQSNQEVFKRLTTEQYSIRDKSLPNQVQDLISSMLKKKAFERATIGQVIHKLQNLQQMLKTAKISTLTLKNIKSTQKNTLQDESKCSQHNNPIQYYKQEIGYCRQCVGMELMSIEDYLKQLPSQKQLLFKLKQTNSLQLTWDLDLEVQAIQLHKKKFLELKPLFQHINVSNCNQSLLRSLNQKKLLRVNAQKQLTDTYQTVKRQLQTKFFEQIDLQLERMVNLMIQ